MERYVLKRRLLDVIRAARHHLMRPKPPAPFDLNQAQGPVGSEIDHLLYEQLAQAANQRNAQQDQAVNQYVNNHLLRMLQNLPQPAIGNIAQAQYQAGLAQQQYQPRLPPVQIARAARVDVQNQLNMAANAFNNCQYQGQHQPQLAPVQISPEAKRNAERLAYETLGHDTYLQLQADGYVEVESKLFEDCQWRVDRGGMNLFKARSKLAYVCITPEYTKGYPAGDALISRYMLCKADEEKICKVGNWTWAVGSIPEVEKWAKISGKKIPR